MPDVHKIMALSTWHLSTETRNWLDGDPNDRKSLHQRSDGTPCGGTWAYGWYLYAHDDNVSYPSARHAPPGEYPADLWACFVKARELGCDCIRFDCDLEPCKDLPVYDETGLKQEDLN